MLSVCMRRALSICHPPAWPLTRRGWSMATQAVVMKPKHGVAGAKLGHRTPAGNAPVFDKTAARH